MEKNQVLSFPNSLKLISFKVEKRKMFGSPVYFLNNNILTGVFQDDIFIRLSEKDRPEKKKKQKKKK